MGSSFRPDAEVEQLLMYETRSLPTPDGPPIEHSEVKVFWNSFDLSVQHLKLSPLEITAMAQLCVSRDGIPFRNAIWTVVYNLHDDAREKLDARIAYLEESLNAAQEKLRRAWRSATKL